ncbi:MAG: 2Fe-2S iron-sulfur cluster-binding protein [Emcibacteraceae bacterium]|nr:2Fe-2S iron-sulfur cluster-binding protein [Emcibacteraceae bacterium]MDG1858827.1 2Fe-2S iron-sulfur cluster-binding protein [Emcibacteraceae bacterium]
MPEIIVTTRENDEVKLEVEVGISVMENLRDGGVDEILAACGGCCSCATCHVYVSEEWMDRTGDISEDENDLLDFSDCRQKNSRLSCQINMSDELNGMRVTVAPED